MPAVRIARTRTVDGRHQFRIGERAAGTHPQRGPGPGARWGNRKKVGGQCAAPKLALSLSSDVPEPVDPRSEDAEIAVLAMPEYRVERVVWAGCRAECARFGHTTGAVGQKAADTRQTRLAT